MYEPLYENDGSLCIYSAAEWLYIVKTEINKYLESAKPINVDKDFSYIVFSLQKIVVGGYNEALPPIEM